MKRPTAQSAPTAALAAVLSVFMLGGAAVHEAAADDTAAPDVAELEAEAPEEGATAPEEAATAAETGEDAPGADVPLPGEIDEGDAVTGLLEAAKDGAWWEVLGFALLLIAAVGAGRGLLGSRWPWFRTDRGGAILAAAGSFAAAVGHTLAAGQPPDLALFGSALLITWSAVGGYTWFKRLISPSDGGKPKP